MLGQPFKTFNPGISPTNALLTQTWTADGQRASLADANGNATGFTYDGFDRLATTTYPGGTTEAFTYDADGNLLTRKTRAGGSIAFAYDTLNRLVTKTPPTGPVVTYTYDLAGRLRSASDNSAAIPSAVSPTGSPVAYTTSFAYDALNRPTATSFDPVNTAAAPGAASSVLFTHSYNKANQRSRQEVSDNSWINYPAAAASTTNYTANNLNQYTAVGAVTPTYDSNGNLTSDGTYNLGYDSENRLVSASGAGNTASYTFDAQGRRKTRTVTGTTTISVTDADNREVLEYNGSTGALLRWYAYGLGPNAVLGQMNIPANTRTTPVPDLLGSIVASVDSGTGTLTKFAYRPYGSAAAAPAPFGFTGQRFDAESGLYYYRARMYSAGWGRFVQTDPIGYDGGINLYVYVDNDPLNLIDPEGLLSWMGVARFVGGSLEAATGIGLGIATGWSGVGAVAGGAIALHGIDVAQAAWRGTDTLTSQGLQSAGVPQNTANAIDAGISGAVAIAAGRPLLPYTQFGPAISGGGQGVSVISATARGFVVPSIQIPGRVTENSGAVANALRSYYGTASVAGLTGRVVSDASVVFGAGLLGHSAYQIGAFGSAHAAEASSGGSLSDPLPFFLK